MKRQRDIEGLGSIDLANCLMLLSCPPQQQQQSKRKSSFGQVEFECKTCNRKFSSFQALGGHRSSHKRSKLLEGDIDGDLKATSLRLGIINKPKVHECSICGQEFSLGQALGGHMRRHRALLINEEFSSSSIEKVMRLDLNLTPLENDLKLLFGSKMAPPMLM